MYFIYLQVLGGSWGDKPIQDGEAWSCDQYFTRPYEHTVFNCMALIFQCLIQGYQMLYWFDLKTGRSLVTNAKMAKTIPNSLFYIVNAQTGGLLHFTIKMLQNAKIFFTLPPFGTFLNQLTKIILHIYNFEILRSFGKQMNQNIFYIKSPIAEVVAIGFFVFVEVSSR